MALKNYTTEIPAMKSIGEIQGILVAHGASSIMINYLAGEPVSLSFLVMVGKKEIPFQLPANKEKVAAVLLKQSASSNYRQWDHAYQEQKKKKLQDQAARVAWRILKDWVDAQMAILETEMVTIQQIFLPYMQMPDGHTLYEAIASKGFYLTEGQK